MDEVRMTVRLPLEAAEFLELEAKKHFTSRNAQVVAVIRAAIKAKGPAAAPTAPGHVTPTSSHRRISDDELRSE